MSSRIDTAIMDSLRCIACDDATRHSIMHCHDSLSTCVHRRILYVGVSPLLEYEMVTISSIHVDIKRSFFDVPFPGPSAPRAGLAQLSISTQFDVSSASGH